MKYFENISKVSNFVQTASGPTGIIIVVKDLYLTRRDRHEYPYPCQRVVLLLHG